MDDHARGADAARSFDGIGRDGVDRASDAMTVAAGQSDHFVRTGVGSGGLLVGGGVGHEIIS